MQHSPTTRKVQPSTEWDSTPTLVETTEGLILTPRWMADVLARVTPELATEVAS